MKTDEISNTYKTNYASSVVPANVHAFKYIADETTTDSELDAASILTVYHDINFFVNVIFTSATVFVTFCYNFSLYFDDPKTGYRSLLIPAFWGITLQIC